MNTIEIRDPALEKEKILQQLQINIEQRLAQGGYGSNPVALGPESLHLTLEPSAEPPLMNSPDFDRALVTLTASAVLSETQFVSNVPIVGPLIVAVRRWWNWMSTKWYVLPVLHQQSQINANVSDILNQLADWQMAQADALTQLQTRISELETRLEKMEKR